MSVYAGPEIVNDGLILCLDAGNTRSYPGSGTAWTDLSSSNNSATLVNDATFSGLNGGSIVFDGSNDYVSGTMTLLPLNSSATIEAVFKYSNSTGPKNIFTQGKNAVSFSCGMVISETELKFRNSASDYSFSPSVNLSTNLWYHCAFSIDINGTTGYINGSSIGSIIQKITNNLQSTYNISRRPDSNSEYANGNIAVIRVYNKALTAAEVYQNFNALRGRFGI